MVENLHGNTFFWSEFKMCPENFKGILAKTMEVKCASQTISDSLVIFSLDINCRRIDISN